MNKISSVFHSSESNPFNDSVYPGSPFLLHNFSYKFRIKPLSAFWRFGIRLSKKYDIKFNQNYDRHLTESPQSFVDLHLAAGDFHQEGWVNPKTLYLTRYNFSDSNKHKNPINFNSHYPPLTEIEFEFEYSITSNLLTIGISSENSQDLYTTFVLGDEFKYFKPFAWADNIEYEIEWDLIIRSTVKDFDPFSHLPIQVGNIIFRQGDIFDALPYYNSDVIVFPVSDEGGITGRILSKINELSIRLPRKGNVGEVNVVQTNRGSLTTYVFYAYSVRSSKSEHSDSSDYSIIEAICKRIKEFVISVPNLDQNARAINLPLLGTGVGKLDSTTIAKIYDWEFNTQELSKQLIVSIPETETYQLIKDAFFGRYFFQVEEFLQKPIEILRLEIRLNISIDHSDFEIQNNKIVSLVLKQVHYSDFQFLDNFKEIESLNLISCNIPNYSFLAKLKKMVWLSLSNCFVVNYAFLSEIKNLTLLSIIGDNINNLSFLRNLKKLHTLTLSNCKIQTINEIGKLTEIRHLDISNNQIENIESISALSKLINLNVSNNKIADIEPIRNLKHLESLSISYNKIEYINNIFLLDNLTFLAAENNPFERNTNLILAEGENHLPPIKNFFSRQLEGDLMDLSLPIKVILLGNHGSGKSSLLQFLLNGSINKETTSTHILNIHSYPSEENDIPQVIYFDFGGQDYYHGFYKSFLSKDSIYLILWNKSTNENKQNVDRKGLITQDFSLSYWLCQKKYIENEKHDGKADPLIIIQSHADNSLRETYQNPENEQLIENEFFVSLQKKTKKGKTVNDFALDYLKSSLQQLINNGRAKAQEPTWYVSFFIHILIEGKKDKSKSRSVSRDMLPKYERTGLNTLSLLKDDLDQLHKRGLVLYYKDKLPDRVWLNPSEFVNYVHDKILNEDLVGKYKGIVPEEVFTDKDPDIIEILCLQNIIFKHELVNGKIEYITPNFLPIVTKSDIDFDLFTFDLDFGTPIFTLKFKNFIPFGIINQLISFFKDFEDDKKKFWRNQLLFTLKQKAKILIQLNFDLLEIKVYSFFLRSVPEEDRVNIAGYLFYCILSVYWDSELLNFENYIFAMKGTKKKDDFKIGNKFYKAFSDFEKLYEDPKYRPIDLFVSLDDKHFINYGELCSDENVFFINSVGLDGDRNFGNHLKQIPISQFQFFTRKTYKRLKKVVISYSKLDLELVNTFKEYLLPLHEDGLIEHPWYCTELIAGENWNDEIQKRFSEADIVFFMISKNSMSTKYIKENEIKNAIDKWNTDKNSIKIIPIVLYYYPWQRAGAYNLGQFVALPYTLKPVTSFSKQDMVWYSISESIRVMIKKDTDPDYKDENALNKEIKLLYEKIVEGKTD